jgi:hypothetical protein
MVPRSSPLAPRPPAASSRAVPRGSAIFAGLLAVLGGLGTVRLGLEPVQGRLLPLFARGVATRRSSITSLDQIGAIAGAQITVTSTPIPIDASLTTVGRGILDGNHPGGPIAQFRRLVPYPSRGVTMISCHIPRHRSVQDRVDRGVALDTALVPLVGDGVPMIGGAVPAIRSGVPLIGRSIPLVRRAFPLGHRILPLCHVRLRTPTRSPWPRTLRRSLTRTHMSAREHRRQANGRRPGRVAGAVPGPSRPTSCTVLSIDARSPAAARALLLAALDAHPADRVDAAVLMIYELVTNAVHHTRTLLLVLITIEDHMLPVDVTEDKPTLPLALDPDHETTNGRVLRIVDALAARWRVTPPSPARPSGSKPGLTQHKGEQRQGRRHHRVAAGAPPGSSWGGSVLDQAWPRTQRRLMTGQHAARTHPTARLPGRERHGAAVDVGVEPPVVGARGGGGEPAVTSCHQVSPIRTNALQPVTSNSTARTIRHV